MKKYGAMRFVAGLLKFVGCLIIAFGVLVLIIPLMSGINVPTSSYVNSSATALVTVLISAAIIIVGIFSVAMGEMISAVADIALNTAATAETSKKTLGYFDQMYNRPN